MCVRRGWASLRGWVISSENVLGCDVSTYAGLQKRCMQSVGDSCRLLCNFLWSWLVMSQRSGFPAKECEFCFMWTALSRKGYCCWGVWSRPAPHSYLSATSQERSTGLTCDTVPSAQAVNTLVIGGHGRQEGSLFKLILCKSRGLLIYFMFYSRISWHLNNHCTTGRYCFDLMEQCSH